MTKLDTNRGAILLLIVTLTVAVIEENKFQLRGLLAITTMMNSIMTGPTAPVAPLTTIGIFVMTTGATPLVADKSMAFPHPTLPSS